MRGAASSLGLFLLAACSAPSGAADGGGADAAVSSPDAGTAALPAVGVYLVGVDGSGFRLLLDAGTHALTHVRKQAGSEWLTATRYSDDADHNGLALELEDPYGAYYAGAEIVVFPLSNPALSTKIAGGVAGKLCANSSFTDDGKLIYVQQDHPSNPDWTRLKRASFSALPTVSATEAITLPPELLVPSDPHQIGPSDGTGKLVFPALFNGPGGWTRPAWLIPASGTALISQASVGGCPICGTGCCASSDVNTVFGAIDPRLNHSGTQLIWMQQHPDLHLGAAPPLYYPIRQETRSLPDGPTVELVPAGGASTTSYSFVEWRGDDAELVYWTIELEGSAIKQRLWRMKPDGSARQQIMVPPELCVSHPSYVSDTEIVFSAWRCAGPSCSCDVKQL